MLSGLNHLTLAVGDIGRSIDFHGRLLGLRLEASWDAGACLSLGDLWPCLSLDRQAPAEPAAGYTHYAFGIAQDDFAAFCARLAQCRARPYAAMRFHD